MENENFGQKVKRKTKSFMKKFLLVVFILGLAIFSFLYWGTYESGIMAGKVLRITEKGMLFKTYEGKLNLETFGALKGASPIVESFDFSVDGKETELIETLEAVALSGERVNLKFKKMEDFSPAQVARQVEPMAKLLEAREQLANLLRYMDGKVAAEDQLKKLLNDPQMMQALRDRAAAKTDEPDAEK